MCEVDSGFAEHDSLFLSDFQCISSISIIHLKGGASSKNLTTQKPHGQRVPHPPGTERFWPQAKLPPFFLIGKPFGYMVK